MSPNTIPLLDRLPTTYESAVDHEDNILNQIEWAQATHDLYTHLWSKAPRETIAKLTAHHLGLSSHNWVRCVVQNPIDWMRGSFNVCVPVHVEDSTGNVVRKVLMRFPLPHKLAERQYPGTVDEKLNCEVATYAWIQEHCPEVPVPHLIGFGFADGAKYTHSHHLPFYVRWARGLRRYFCHTFGFPIPSMYIRHSSRESPRMGYLLLDYVEKTQGQMLSRAWTRSSHDIVKRDTLFQGIARLILALAKVPLPRIGAFEFHDDGTLTLTNRPLTCGVMIHENEGAPRILKEKTTYNCVDPYISDLLTFHDHRFTAQQNAICSERDCRSQIAVKALLRTVAHHYHDRDSRYGPFRMQFTDLHPSNIFVDGNWNITAIVDLEWICSRPAFMIDVPYWISGHTIDEIGEEENMDNYCERREDFMHILCEEERSQAEHSGQTAFLGPTMQLAWQTGACWFAHCLDSVDAMYPLFDQHLRKGFTSFSLTENMERLISRFWRGDVDDLVETKLSQRAEYLSLLAEKFRDEGEDQDSTESKDRPLEGGNCQ